MQVGSGQALSFNMMEYLISTVDLYKDLTGVSKFRHASTPFVPEGSITAEDLEERGELDGPSKVLMKALWLARLARPDILKPICDLASHVQKWTRACDKKLCRLIAYLDSTPEYRLLAVCNDPADKLCLRLYVDADFAGSRSEGDARSTSGGWLCLSGPNTHVPLAWVAKKQTSTARSTTEAEIISLAHSLFSEAVPVWDLWQMMVGKELELHIMEDNQATIIVAKKGFSAKLRHVNRVHAVDLSSLKEMFQQPGCYIQYVKTEDQSADIFTKALAPQKWDNALKLLGICTTSLKVLRAG